MKNSIQAGLQVFMVALLFLFWLIPAVVSWVVLWLIVGGIQQMKDYRTVLDGDNVDLLETWAMFVNIATGGELSNTFAERIGYHSAGTDRNGTIVSYLSTSVDRMLGTDGYCTTQWVKRTHTHGAQLQPFTTLKTLKGLSITLLINGLGMWVLWLILY